MDPALKKKLEEIDFISIDQSYLQAVRQKLDEVKLKISELKELQPELRSLCKHLFPPTVFTQTDSLKNFLKAWVSYLKHKFFPGLVVRQRTLNATFFETYITCKFLKKKISETVKVRL